MTDTATLTAAEALAAERKAAFDKAEEEAKQADAEPIAKTDAEIAEGEAAPVGADPEVEAAPVSRETSQPTPAQIIKGLEYIHDNCDLANPHRVIIMDAVAMIRSLTDEQ